MTLFFRRCTNVEPCAVGIACVVVAVQVFGCSGVDVDQAARPPERTTPTMNIPGHHTPDPPRTFVPGPPIRPAAPLLAWLDQHRIEKWPRKQDRQVRLPVVLRLDRAHTHIVEAFIGVADATDGETIFLRINDGLMGISLKERVRMHCPSTFSTCVVWLNGYWGGLLPTELDDVAEPGKPRRWPFASVWPLERFAPGAAGEEVRARVESSGP